MKLALVVPGGVDRSGVDRVVPALLWQIERLARRHTLHVFALAQEPLPAQWKLLGATIHNIGTAPGKRRRFLRSFAAEHARAPFDVIHAFWSGAGEYATIASIRHRIPFALHLAGGELVALDDIGYGERRTLRGRARLRMTLAIADHVSVASGYMQQLATPLRDDTELIPLGVALDRWPARNPRERDTSSSARRARLLHIGDLRPVKDQTLLLHAAARLRDRGIDFQLDVAGFDTMAGATQSLAAQLGLADRVRWLGVLRRDALRAVVEEADVLLVTSRHDAGPLAFLEAAVAGVPTVGTRVGHIADWAPDAAVCVDHGDDANAFADAVAELLCDEPRRLAIAREAQRRAVVIDADLTASRFEAMYDSLLRSRSPHTSRVPRAARSQPQS